MNFLINESKDKALISFSEEINVLGDFELLKKEEFKD